MGGNENFRTISWKKWQKLCASGAFVPGVTERIPDYVFSGGISDTSKKEGKTESEKLRVEDDAALSELVTASTVAAVEGALLKDEPRLDEFEYTAFRDTFGIHTSLITYLYSKGVPFGWAVEKESGRVFNFFESPASGQLIGITLRGTKVEKGQIVFGNGNFLEVMGKDEFSDFAVDVTGNLEGDKVLACDWLYEHQMFLVDYDGKQTPLSLLVADNQDIIPKKVVKNEAEALLATGHNRPPSVVKDEEIAYMSIVIPSDWKGYIVKNPFGTKWELSPDRQDILVVNNRADKIVPWLASGKIVIKQFKLVKDAIPEVLGDVVGKGSREY